MSFRDRAAFGKRQEFIAIAELLKRGFDVYLTLVDDQQIDCVVRQENRGKPVYLDVQIKARSKECKPENAARFAALKIPNPRPNYVFIFYSEQRNAYWVMPSKDVIGNASENKTGQGMGSYTIVFPKTGEKAKKLDEEYRDNFDILRRLAKELGSCCEKEHYPK